MDMRKRTDRFKFGF